MKKVMAMLMLLSVMCCAGYGAETADSEIYLTTQEGSHLYMNCANLS